MTDAAAALGGIAVTNLNILQALVELRTEVPFRLSVLSYLEAADDRLALLPDAVRYRGFGGSKLRFARAIARKALDGSLFFFERVGLMLPLLPWSLFGRCRALVFAHGSENWAKVRRADAWSLRAATRILTNSHFTSRRIRERFPTARVEACPLGLSPRFPLHDAIPPAPSERMTLTAVDGTRRPLGDRVLLLVGRLHPEEREKGHDQIIRALSLLEGRFPRVQAVFAGPGEDSTRVAELARGAGVADRVFLPGPVSVRTLHDLYARCYAFVMPSRQEGFGLVYLEAMNYGKPCIGCFDDGAEDVIVDGVTGLLIRDPDDTRALASAIESLLTDPAAARAMGSRGFERLHEQFTAAHFRRRLKACVRPLIRGARTTGTAPGPGNDPDRLPAVPSGTPGERG